MGSKSSVLVLALALAPSALGQLAEAADIPAPMPVKAVAAPPPVSGWTFQFTPYLWAAGLKGDVALGPLAPPVAVDLSFGDIFDHLKMAFMGTFEARNGRFGLIADIAYLRLEASATGPLGFVNAELEDRTLFATFLGAYRAIDQGSAWVDVTAGGRLWWIDTHLDITAPGPVAVSVNRDQSWIDPVIGLRARAYLTPQLFVQFDGDVGGFGVASKSTWQAAGILGYQYSAMTSFFAGYRHLEVDYRRNGFVWDVQMSGPVVGASFRF
jgi:hypothetical protein